MTQVSQQMQSSMMVHELKNNLAAIAMQLEVFKFELCKDKQARISNIIDTVKDSSQMMSDILDIFKSENIKDKLVECSIREAAITAGARIRASLEENICMFITEGDFKYIGMHDLTIQLIFNLLKNAHKSLTKSDKEHKNLYVRINPEKRTLIIEDNGVGIEQDKLEKIFDPFESGSSSHGIGLTFCKALVETYGGTIKCESTVGKNAIFTIRLPSENK